VSEETFGILTTNRASVGKYLQQFKKNKQGDESLISPRPHPRGFLQRYFILLRFSGESKNRVFFTTHKSFKPLSKDEYNAQRLAIKAFWEA
jgi:hypothetical protein